MNDLHEDPRDLEARLGAELRASALTIPELGDPNRAVARADQRRRRRVAATAVAGVALAGGLTAGALSLRPDAETSIYVADGGDAAVGAATSSLSLEWRSAQATVDWPMASFVAADGYRYALSTAPGTRFSDAIGSEPTPVPQAIYRTLDGENWEVIEQTGPNLNDLGTLDGVLYAVSTATDANGDVVNQVRRSADGGDWQATDVPLGFSELNDPNGLLSSFSAGDAASRLTVGDDRMIISATRYAYLDDYRAAEFLGFEGDGIYSEVMVDDSGAGRVVFRDSSACDAASGDMGTASPSTTMASADGSVETVEPSEDLLVACDEPPIVADRTFEELGISGSFVETKAAVSTDGVTWTPIEVPGQQLYFAGGYFVAVDYTESGPVTSRSSDGTTWESVPSNDGFDVVGVSGDQLVAHNYYENGTDAVAVSSDGGASWNGLTLANLAPELSTSGFISTVAAGDLGIVVVIGDPGATDTLEPSHWTIATSADGVTWTAQNVGDIDGIDAGYPGWAFVDSDHIGVVFSAERNQDGSVAAVTLLGTPTR